MTKRILITGSTDGIGKLAAIELAKQGHTIYLHGRNEVKLNTLVAEIKETTNNEHIHGFVADFSDLNAVRQMAASVKDALPSLDVLINNAGVYKSSQRSNADGLDLRFVVNYLAPYVFTEELLPLLKNSQRARIINLSSAAQSTVNYEMLSGAQEGAHQDIYAQSKLALTMWSFHLANQLEGVSVIALNPGSLLNTNMVREGYGRFWSPAEKGSDIIVGLAVGSEYEGITGKYFDNDKGGFGPAHADAYSAEAIDKLIKVTESML